MPSPDLLSSGNLATVSLALYRQHFRAYALVSLQSLLWYFIPLYGWAKGAQLQALIARQAYSELIEQPETLAAIRQRFQYFTWDIGAIHLLVGLASLGLNIVFFFLGVVISIGIGIPAAILVAASGGSVILTLLLQLLQVAITLLQWAALFWFYCRFLSAELVLLVEPRAHAWSALSRSWRLTKRGHWRVQLAASSLFLMTLPLWLLATSLTSAIATAITLRLQAEVDPIALSSVLGWGIALLFGLFLLVLLGVTVLTVPLWQALKAAVYFDLLNRREGRDLHLRSGRVPADSQPPTP